MRALRKHWKLAAIAIFSLSIAMGLGVIALSASNTFLLLRPAAREADRLVMLYSSSPEKAVDQISYADFRYLRENNHVFTDIAAAPDSIDLLFDDNEGRQGIRVLARPITDNYLAVMGIRPLLGRLLQPGDDHSTTPIAVMTYSCWVRLGSDPNMIGRKIGSFSIVGVTPKEFTGAFYGFNGDLLTPLVGWDYNGDWRRHRDARRLFLIARLKPGVSQSQAQAEVSAMFAQLTAAYPKEEGNRKGVVARATLLPPDGMATAEVIFGTLLAVALLVLLVACANVANLLLAIAVGRRQEASIKLALGAPRGRLIREFLKESALLCLGSGVLGFGVAAAVLHQFANVTFSLPIYGEYSLALNLRLDGTVIAFALGLMLIAILATGLAPALYASSPHVAQVLSGEIAVGGTGKRVKRNVLVMVQVAACTVVLVGMGLCQRSLYNLRHVDLGFSARNLVVVQVARNGKTGAQLEQSRQDLKREIGSIAGVEAVSLAAGLPLFGGAPEPVKLPGSDNKIPVQHTTVDADYFSTFGIRIFSGRVFNSFDRENTPAAVVINRKMAEMLWPGKDAVGQEVVVGDSARRATVIGVVADGKYEDLDETPQPFLYYALSQQHADDVYVVARTTGDPARSIAPVAQAVKKVGFPVPLTPYVYRQLMDLSLLMQRIVAAGVTGLSALGTLLAVIGLFGAVSYSVSERKKEFGIRVALGAGPPQLVAMILGQTLRVAGAGVAIGILLSIAATVLLRSQFYGIDAVEWTVLLPVGGAMAGMSLLVAYVSALPWIRINPMEAVRHA